MEGPFRRLPRSMRCPRTATQWQPSTLAGSAHHGPPALTEGTASCHISPKTNGSWT